MVGGGGVVVVVRYGRQKLRQNECRSPRLAGQIGKILQNACIQRGLPNQQFDSKTESPNAALASNDYLFALILS